MNRNHALGFISFVMLAAAGSFVACSSSSTGTTPGVTTDSGTHDTGATDTGTTPTDTGTDDTATNPTDTGTGDTGQCSKVGTLHPPSPDAGGLTIYCPFSSDGGADAANVYCEGQTQHCCETPATAGTPSTCEALATACPIMKSTDWKCQDPVADCPSSTPVCCAPGASIGFGQPGCGNFAHTMTGTQCVAAGACTGIIMCTSDAECPTGQHCTPFTKAGAQVGGCSTM